MVSAMHLSIEVSVQTVYENAFALYGDIGISREEYLGHLTAVAEKHLGANPSRHLTVSLFGKLHTNDLYLCAACALPSEDAWRYFIANYRKYIYEIAYNASRKTDAATDLADRVMAELFMPDRCGRTRIASYDGQSSLATWLRVIVSRKAIDEGELKWNSFERLDCLTEIADAPASCKAEEAIRSKRYDPIIQDVYKEACQSLTDRERLILTLLYEETWKAAEIAEMLCVHPSTVTRSLRQAHAKLRSRILSVLSSKYNLDAEATQEPLTAMLENPAHSLLAFVTSKAC